MARNKSSAALAAVAAAAEGGAPGSPSFRSGGGGGPDSVAIARFEAGGGGSLRYGPNAAEWPAAAAGGDAKLGLGLDLQGFTGAGAGAAGGSLGVPPSVNRSQSVLGSTASFAKGAAAAAAEAVAEAAGGVARGGALGAGGAVAGRAVGSGGREQAAGASYARAASRRGPGVPMAVAEEGETTEEGAVAAPVAAGTMEAGQGQAVVDGEMLPLPPK